MVASGPSSNYDEADFNLFVLNIENINRKCGDMPRGQDDAHFAGIVSVLEKCGLERIQM